MSAISDFAARQDEFNDRLEAALEGVSNDVKTLNDLIVKLQETSGKITPEDQAILDDIQTKAETLAKKAEALDSMNPPPTPPTE